MLDPKLIRQDIDKVVSSMKKRGMEFNSSKLNILEDKRRVLQNEIQELQNQRNQHAKKVGQTKAAGGDVELLLREVKTLGDELERKEKDFSLIQEELNQNLARLANIPHESVPIGKSEADNVEIRKWGTPRKFDFEPLDHVELGVSRGMDFESAAKLSGARFVVLHDKMAKLQRVLAQFMLELHIQEHGYKEVAVPFIVNSKPLFGTGQLPKMADDLFAIQSEDKIQQYLIPTSEVPVANLVADSIIDANNLPMRYVCYSQCFRSEAGSYGKDTKGMIRHHQFDKVELVQIVKPEDSYASHEEITAHAEKVLQKLNLPYRVVELCTGDLGFSAAKTYDIEVWLPAQNTYREISSCSNTMCFQARRMKARFRNNDSSKPEYLHTLNGSALAVGRTLVAILENGQQKDGRILLPDALQDLMGCDFI